MGYPGTPAFVRHPRQDEADDQGADERQDDGHGRRQRLEVLAVAVERGQRGEIECQAEQGYDDPGDGAGRHAEEGEPLQRIRVSESRAEQPLRQSTAQTRGCRSSTHGGPAFMGGLAPGKPGEYTARHGVHPESEGVTGQ